MAIMWKLQQQHPMLLLIIILLVQVFFLATCDIDKDKQKCANDLVGLATCLPYVSGDSKTKTPPVDCCTGLKQVLQKSPECLCLLVKDRNDPSLGFKINATLALSLPTQCHSPANVTDCPALLHLPPNSADAKVFQDFANSGNNGNSSASTAPPATGSLPSGGDSTLTPTTSANLNSSDVGITIRRWAAVQMICALLAVLYHLF